MVLWCFQGVKKEKIDLIYAKKLGTDCNPGSAKLKTHPNIQKSSQHAKDLGDIWQKNVLLLI